MKTIIDYLKFIKKPIIILLVIMIISLWFSYFVFQVLKKRSWLVNFWSLDYYEMSQTIWGNTNKTISVRNGDTRYSWDIKSALVDNDIIYFLYYYPFDVVNDEKDKSISEYELGNSLKEKEDESYYNKSPFYLIYNKKSSEITYLNAKKEVLKWSKNFNGEILKTLDKSNLVSLWNIHFETSFGDKNPTTEYGWLIKRFNDYLNLQINK